MLITNLTGCFVVFASVIIVIGATGKMRPLVLNWNGDAGTRWVFQKRIFSILLKASRNNELYFNVWGKKDSPEGLNQHLPACEYSHWTGCSLWHHKRLSLISKSLRTCFLESVAQQNDGFPHSGRVPPLKEPLLKGISCNAALSQHQHAKAN